jgi:hypothetical protein
VPAAAGADDAGADGELAGPWADGVGGWLDRVAVACAFGVEVAAGWLAVGGCVTGAAVAVPTGMTGGGWLPTLAGGAAAEQAAVIIAVATAAVASASRAGQRSRACLPSLIEISLAVVVPLPSWCRCRRGTAPGWETAAGGAG